MIKKIKDFLYCKKYNNEYVNNKILSFSEHWKSIQVQQNVTFNYLQNR